MFYRKLQKNNVDPAGMNFLVGPDSEAQVLSIDALTKVNEAGDGGAALRNAVIGRLFGFIFFMTQNVPSVPEMTGALGATIDNAAGYPIGATAIDLEDVTLALVAGQWLKIGIIRAARSLQTVGTLASVLRMIVIGTDGSRPAGVLPLRFCRQAVAILRPIAGPGVEGIAACGTIHIAPVIAPRQPAIPCHFHRRMIRVIGILQLKGIRSRIPPDPAIRAIEIHQLLMG